eukprot:3375794-Pleurochrysis_carterae.AAC.1
MEELLAAAEPVNVSITVILQFSNSRALCAQLLLLQAQTLPARTIWIDAAEADGRVARSAVRSAGVTAA